MALSNMLALCAALSTAALADAGPDTHILAGQCASKAEIHQHLGAAMGNPANVDTRPCDKVVLTFITPEHIMVQFVDRNQSATRIMGFAGYLLNNTIMEVHNLYPSPALKLNATSGHCMFSFEGSSMSGVVCVANAATGPRAVELFQALPGQ